MRRRRPAQAVVHWLTAPGRAYQVLRSAQPSGGPWNVLATVSGDGDGCRLRRHQRRGRLLLLPLAPVAMTHSHLPSPTT